MDNRQDFKKINTDELVARVQGLRLSTALGADYQLCKKAAEPLLEEINLRVAEIAKRFNQKPYKFTFAGFGRNMGRSK